MGNLKRSYEIRDKVNSSEDSECVSVLNSMGVVYKQQGNYVDAIDCYQKAVNVMKRCGKESLGWAIALNNIGALYKCQGQFGQALHYFEKSLEMKCKVLGRDAVMTKATLNNMMEVKRMMKGSGQEE